MAGETEKQNSKFFIEVWLIFFNRSNRIRIQHFLIDLKVCPRSHMWLVATGLEGTSLDHQEAALLPCTETTPGPGRSRAPFLTAGSGDTLADMHLPPGKRSPWPNRRRASGDFMPGPCRIRPLA